MRSKFSVDSDLCIGCGLCQERAPENLEIPDGEWSARVFKQPADADEEEACREASEYCPTGGLRPEEEV
ncbi:MAG: ferredoxin [Myxococcota bacterium]